MEPAGFDHKPNAQNAQESLKTRLDVCLDIIEAKKP